MMIRFALLFVFVLGINSLTDARSVKKEAVTNQNQKKIYSHYCIVVGSFSSLPSAQKYGSMAQAKGYDVSYRDNGHGFFRVCLFDFKTESEAYKRMKELKPIGNLFKQVWVLGYDNGSEKVAAKVEPAAKPVAKPPVEKEIKQEPAPVPAKKTSNPAVRKASNPISSVAEKKSDSDPVVEKTTSAAPAPEKVRKPAPDQGKVYSHYCVVVGSFATADEAKQYGASVESKGYEAFFRKYETGSIIVCLYNLKTKSEADKRIDKMQHIDAIFAQAWVFGYDNVRENLSIDQL